MLLFCKRGFIVCSFWLQVVSDGVTNRMPFLPANIADESETAV